MAHTIVFYISGHGFGHASRDIEVLNALHRMSPTLRVIVRTSAPRWIFDLTLAAPIEWRPFEADTGIVQIDSLQLDVDETLRRADAFCRALPGMTLGEAAFLEAEDATLVVGDIPPLAFAAAAQAGLPSIALGNFTWDWIYDSYPETGRDWPDLVPTVRRAYRDAALALRLPMHGGFEPFGRVIDVPFIARRSSRRPRTVREAFGLPLDGRIVLASFGGYGLRDIDLMRLGDVRGWTVVTTSNVQARRREPDFPDGSSPAGIELPANVRFVDERDIYAAGYRYEDIVAAVDAVATKPGYGIIAECVANDTAILYTSRGRFVEYEVLVREMPRYVRAAFISNEDLYAGRWQAPLEGLVGQAAPPERPRVDGAEVVASMVLELLERRRRSAG